MAVPRSDVQLDPKTFDVIASLAYQISGLTLVIEKAPMVQSRLRPRLGALGFPDFEAYAEFLTTDAGQSEQRQLISALTTNVSSFFREAHHFETLCSAVRPKLPALRKGARLRVWSAGCSQGQEPLSIAMSLLDDMPELSKLDFRILATDIDPKVISFARNGVYSQRMLQDVSPEQRTQFFTELSDTGEAKARPDVLDLIRHKELNLLSPWPIKGQFDAIFCRNTVIYFDAETQGRLWPRFRQALVPDGNLFLGHSERITDPAAFGFRCTGPTTYTPMSQ